MGKPGPAPEVGPEDVLGVFTDREDPAEPLTAPEVADRLGCSRRTALNRLHELADRGDVESKKVGGRSRVWWVPIPRDGDGEADLPPLEDDPVFGLPTFSGEGPTDVSENVDEHVAAAIAGESNDGDA